jgi:hypothetical protein
MVNKIERGEIKGNPFVSSLLLPPPPPTTTLALKKQNKIDINKVGSSKKE